MAICCDACTAMIQGLFSESETQGHETKFKTEKVNSKLILWLPEHCPVLKKALLVVNVKYFRPRLIEVKPMVWCLRSPTLLHQYMTLFSISAPALH